MLVVPGKLLWETLIVLGSSCLLCCKYKNYLQNKILFTHFLSQGLKLMLHTVCDMATRSPQICEPPKSYVHHSKYKVVPSVSVIARQFYSKFVIRKCKLL